MLERKTFKSQQGAYDLLKHEGLINLLSRREVLLPRSFLRLFAIVIAGGGRYRPSPRRTRRSYSSGT
jgi:hypothetical protein